LYNIILGYINNLETRSKQLRSSTVFLKRNANFHQQKEKIKFIKAGFAKGIVVKEEYNIFYKKDINNDEYRYLY
jgi:hypothetical protein